MSDNIMNVLAVGSSVSLCGESQYYFSGAAGGHISFGLQTVTTGAWVSLGTSTTWGATAGNQIIFNCADVTNGRMYRVTSIKYDSLFTNPGNYIMSIERIA
jgi:hypothetical protein